MIEKIVYPNVVTFKILIDALCKEKLLRRNVDNVDRIVGKRNSHFPSVIVYFSLQVLKRYYKMEYKFMCWGLSVFSSMIQCLCAQLWEG